MFSLARSNRIFLWLIAALMVITQTFAAMHGVVHADRHLPADAHHHAHDDGDNHNHQQSSAIEDDGQDAHLLSSLFSLHESESDCRLFDQARGDGALLAMQSLWLPPSVPPSTVAIFQGEALARWAALFDARAPPLTV